MWSSGPNFWSGWVEICQPGFVAASIFTKPGEVEARNIVREAAGIRTRGQHPAAQSIYENIFLDRNKYILLLKLKIQNVPMYLVTEYVYFQEKTLGGVRNRDKGQPLNIEHVHLLFCKS